MLDRAASLGAKTIVPITEIPGRVTYAMLGDPDGLLVGVMKGQDALASADKQIRQICTHQTRYLFGLSAAQNGGDARHPDVPANHAV